MSEIVEQRVKPTLIRRRAKKEEPPAVEPAPQIPKEPAAAPVLATPAKTPLSAAPVAPEAAGHPKPLVPKVATGPEPKTGSAAAEAKPSSIIKPLVSTVGLEEKFKKAPKKKLSKAEMDFEEIKRAGGLKHVAVDEDSVSAAPEIRERVFEPGPRRKKAVRREFKKTKITTPGAAKKNIRISETITISELSQHLGVKANELLQKMVALGAMATINQAIDVDTASLLAKEYGYEVEHIAFKEEDAFQEVKEKRAAHVQPRPPVVTVMGHVDHGKTSILDYIRKAKVAAGEAGGITQHIGAYEVALPKGKITFIDTPGHAAFTAMRARGAKVTDLVVLVVAADDGVMPQTKEAIDHAKAAGVPMIVAINKIDKPEANAERVKRALSEYGIITEEWGGETISVSTSAKSGQGIDQLLEMILLQAEVMELKADANAPVKGTIIEAKLDRGLGPNATVLVREGTLKLGDVVICGLYSGKVRTLINSRGDQVEKALPSEAVSLIGLNGVPMAGDELMEVKDEKEARFISETRQKKQRIDALTKISRVTLEDLHKQVADGTLEELGIVLKADVHGSVEAVKEAVSKLSTDKVKIKVLHAGVGAVTESDVMLAAAGNGIIIGFNVVPEVGVNAIAELKGVEIRRYSIIYELLDEVRKSMEGLLAPLQVEKVVGHASVRQVFTISKVGVIAGCSVSDGKILRNASARLLRDNAVIYTGKLESLRRFKDDAREVNEGNECGIAIGYNDIKEGDVIEAFIIEQIAQKL
ncbi:MAG: translation initiation factor IF-2 [Deltaproteobacteria bacterium]|nr:translation initiation factor IF-2 [Deltaproteobacteria bacterium]